MQKCKEDYLKEEEEKQYNLKLTEEHWFVENPLDDNFRYIAKWLDQKLLPLKVSCPCDIPYSFQVVSKWEKYIMLLLLR